LRNLIVADYDKEIVDLAERVFRAECDPARSSLIEPKVQLPMPEAKADDLTLCTIPSEANSDRQMPGPPPSASDLALSETKTFLQGNAVKVETSPDLTKGSEVKQTKTAEELAAMIEADVAKHPECPRTGFQVTVYGTTLWRAMLTIKPAAGPVRNPQEWRDLTEELADRLRSRYDLAWR
jgi:hypothetical protein